jgi:hypothetical protein
MKRVVVVAVVTVAAVLVGLLAVRTEASASGSGDPRIAVLQKQVKALQKQVSNLTNQVVYNFDGDTCLAALTADLLQGTWVAVDQATQKTTFGSQNQVQDYGKCERLANPDVPRATPLTVPPTIAPMLPLLKWLGS